MSAVSVYSGSVTLTVGAGEVTLESSSMTQAGAYILRIDASSFASKTTIEVRAKVKTLSTSGLTAVFYQAYTTAQSVPIIDLDPIAIDGVVSTQISFTLKQTAGTAAHAVPFNIMRL